MRKFLIESPSDNQQIGDLSDAERKLLYQDTSRLAKAVGASWLLSFRKGRTDNSLNYASWDAVTGEFTIYGRRISAADLRAVIANSERLLEQKLTTLIDKLERGKITFDQFKREFERTNRAFIVFSAALATGGIYIALNSDIVKRELSEQKQYLAERLKTTAVDIIFPVIESQMPEPEKTKRKRKLRNVLKSYVRRGHTIFEQTRQRIFETLGIYTLAKRHLRPAEHCMPCVEWAAKGWLPISEMPPIGAFPFDQGGCSYNCRCWIEYK